MVDLLEALLALSSSHSNSRSPIIIRCPDSRMRPLRESTMISRLVRGPTGN